MNTTVHTHSPKIGICLISHRWNTVRRTGSLEYRECHRCEKRMVINRNRRSQKIDNEWLQGLKVSLDDPSPRRVEKFSELVIEDLPVSAQRRPRRKFCPKQPHWQKIVNSDVQYRPRFEAVLTLECGHTLTVKSPQHADHEYKSCPECKAIIEEFGSLSVASV